MTSFSFSPGASGIFAANIYNENCFPVVSCDFLFRSRLAEPKYGQILAVESSVFLGYGLSVVSNI